MSFFLVNLESEAVEEKQRQSLAEQVLAVTHQRIQQLFSGSSVPTTALLARNSGMNNLAIHVQGILRDTERLGSCYHQ